MTNTKEKGYLAEQEFIKLLNENGIPYEYLDDWADFKIYNKYIDVKSTIISHKFTNRKRSNQQYKIGHYQITDTQLKKKCYLALFIRIKDRFLFVGIIKINKRTKKRISLHKIREEKIYEINEFIEEIKCKKISKVKN